MAHDPHPAIFFLALILAGLTSGFAGGLFGIGGGVLRIPIFLYLFPAFGVTTESAFHLAAGTSLALAIPTSAMAAWRQHREHQMDPEFLRTWIPPLLVGVLGGVVASSFSSGLALRWGFMGLLGAMLLYFTLPNRPRIAQKVPGGARRGLLAGSVGMISTLLGLTGGVLTTPALMACSMPIHRAVAVSTAGSLAISFVATAGMIWSGLGVPGRSSYALGYVDLVAVAAATPAVILAAPWGVRLANRLPERLLELAFAALLLALILDTAFDAISGH